MTRKIFETEQTRARSFVRKPSSLFLPIHAPPSRFRRSSNLPECGSQYLNQCIVTEQRINTYTEKHVAISKHVRLLRLFCPPEGTCTRVMLLWQGGYSISTGFVQNSLRDEIRICLESVWKLLSDREKRITRILIIFYYIIFHQKTPQLTEIKPQSFLIIFYHPIFQWKASRWREINDRLCREMLQFWSFFYYLIPQRKT